MLEDGLDMESDQDENLDPYEITTTGVQQDEDTSDEQQDDELNTSSGAAREEDATVPQVVSSDEQTEESGEGEGNIVKEPDLPVLDLYQQQKSVKKRKLDQNPKPKKKLKKEATTEEPTQGFITAINTILGKSIDGDVPIMQNGKIEVEKLSKEEKKEKNKISLRKHQKKLLLNKDHVVLTHENENWNQERILKQTATERVVKIFNAVRLHQREFAKETEKINNPKKVERLTKEKFLEILKDSKTGKLKTPKIQQQQLQHDEKVDSKPQWGVLSDDYMLGASLKDWKDQEEEEEFDQNEKQIEQEQV